MTPHQFLTMKKTERDAAKLLHPHEAAEAAKLFNGGKCCGCCQHFNQLGQAAGSRKHTGMNGTCSVVHKREYTKPEDKACGKFERVE